MSRMHQDGGRKAHRTHYRRLVQSGEFMRLKTYLLFVLASLAVSACFDSSEPQKKAALENDKKSTSTSVMKFKNVEEMADFTQDFTVEEGTLKVISNDPLHIELTVKEENPVEEYAADAMARALLWGVYRTFLHTDANSVKVTVISPAPVDGRKSFTASSTREHALKTVKQLLDVREMGELLTERQTWSDAMKRCYYSDFGPPGLRNCTVAVAGSQDPFRQ